MSVDLGFPLCRAGHESAVRDVIAQAVAFLRERLGDRLVGVILTGSFARGEGSVLAVNGHARVLGDIEFLVVLPGRGDYRALRPQMAAWSAEATCTLGARALRVDLEFGPVEVDYLRKRARPSIFVYDLVTHGRVVWGRPDLLKLVPAFGTERIPREDAVALLFNRTVEQLDLYERLDALEGEALLDAAYQRLKLLLDLAGSALAFEGAHVSSYDERPAAFARLLARTPALAALLPPGFVDDLAAAARAKLAPASAGLTPPGATAAGQRAWLREGIVAAVPAVTAFLRWELEAWLDAHGPLEDLLERYLRAQPYRRRAWEWARVALHPMPAPRPLSAVRAARLFARSTPRALIYAAATLAYLELGGDSSAPAVARLLPLPAGDAPRTAAEARAAVTALWRWCIRNN